MSKRILVVDDEPLLLDLLTHLLVRDGHQVVQAERGIEALRKLKDQTFDAIFLDVKFPDIDGTEVYRRIQELSPDLAERIIFATGDIANHRTISFIEATGNLYLEKPFPIHRVAGILKELSLRLEALSVGNGKAAA